MLEYGIYNSIRDKFISLFVNVLLGSLESFVKWTTNLISPSISKRSPHSATLGNHHGKHHLDALLVPMGLLASWILNQFHFNIIHTMFVLYQIVGIVLEIISMPLIELYCYKLLHSLKFKHICTWLSNYHLLLFETFAPHGVLQYSRTNSIMAHAKNPFRKKCYTLSKWLDCCGV